MEIVVLGTGCPKCQTLEKMTRETASGMGIDATVRKEDDILKIMQYGVMRTPALVIDGKVVLSGRLPGAEELKKLLTQK
ncbi:MAG TPA: thioredoxin family protein [Prolixibacteraceae bacterium]|nr:thioredoxin family protein [Prolixibacteraceae bacterium]